jgi:hypothetical protein
MNMLIFSPLSNMGEKLWISVTNHEDDFVAEKQEGLLEKSYYTLHLKGPFGSKFLAGRESKGLF